MEVRTFRPEDYPAVRRLWLEAGIELGVSDTPEAIVRLRQRDDLFVVAEVDGRLVGAVLGTFDGRRGWVHHLAVAAGHRGRGAGAALLGALEDRLRTAGCAKANLLIEPENRDVQAFYERSGYRIDELVFMAKWL